MKKFVIILIIGVSVFAKEYSIIAFSSKHFDKKAAELFIKRFPNGIVKKYTRFVEYKIEPFKNYQEARNFLKKVKRYYRYPLIIKYNPNLGIVLYPKKKKNYVYKKKPANTTYRNRYLTYCMNECGCKSKKRYDWELNTTKILQSINVKVKEYLKNVKPNAYNENNETAFVYENANSNNTCSIAPMSDYRFYIDLYGNIYNGQKYKSRLYGDSENVKLGVIYEKYFWDKFKFYTDDRIILSRKNDSGNTGTDVYLDINELYLRSYCLNKDWANFLIGRKKTKDFRSWWYDDPLDQIRIFSDSYLLSYELIFATRINNETITDNNSPKAKLKGSRFFIFHTDYEYYYRNHAGFYYMYEKTKPKDLYVYDRKLHYLGFDLHGTKKNIQYWLNLGYAKGDINKYTKVDDVKGYGFDVGAKMPVNRKLSLAASYAYAKGGDKYFTQPYIATDNSDYLQKSFSFRYYGNVLDPVLENIRIISLYGLYDFSPNKSLIASLHNYRQDEAESVLYSGNYVYPTDGKSKNIGNEMDIVYQYLKNRYEKLKIGAGLFFGGSAYDNVNSKNAYRIYVNYRHYWK